MFQELALAADDPVTYKSVRACVIAPSAAALDDQTEQKILVKHQDGLQVHSVIYNKKYVRRVVLGPGDK